MRNCTKWTESLYIKHQRMFLSFHTYKPMFDVHISELLELSISHKYKNNLQRHFRLFLSGIFCIYTYYDNICFGIAQFNITDYYFTELRIFKQNFKQNFKVMPFLYGRIILQMPLFFLRAAS